MEFQVWGDGFSAWGYHASAQDWRMRNAMVSPKLFRYTADTSVMTCAGVEE